MVIDATAYEASLDAAILAARELIAMGKYVEAEACMTGTRRPAKYGTATHVRRVHE